MEKQAQPSLSDFLRSVASRLVPYRRNIYWCLFLSLAAAGLSTLGPVLMGRGFDLAGQHRSFWLYGGALAGWWLLSLAADLFRSHVATQGSNIAEKAAIEAEADSILVLLDKPLAQHFGSKMGETRETVSGFRWRMENFIEGTMFDLAPALLTIVAVLGYLIYLDWQIALILAAAMAVFLGYSYSCSRSRLELQKKIGELERMALAGGWDALYNVLVVKSTTNEALVRDQLVRGTEQYGQAMADFNSYQRRMYGVQNTIIGCGMFGSLAVGAYHLAGGALTFGQLSSATAFAFTIFGQVRWATWQFSHIIRCLAKYRDIRAILDMPAEDLVSGREVRLGGNVEFRHVRFRYREDKPALEDISFQVKAGDRVALVGESGEGKTTLVDLLGRYFETQSGEILLDGQPIGGINLRCLRRQLAYVPQDLSMFNETIGFNIRYGRPEATADEVREAARRAHLDDFIDALPEKYETRVGERGLKLSGGERQRVALARAFLRDPIILILDEPTSNLDSKTEEYVRTSLNSLMKGRTTFIVAHRLSTIRESDLILVLKRGRIVEHGTHEELLGRPDSAYVELLRAQGGCTSLGHGAGHVDPGSRH